MASSSCSTPASISQPWNHEVFLSFRGEDTRKSFVDHLYTALEQKGIQTYKDDETLPRGERIGPTLLKAIQESRIAVVVFSKHYADSSWCLDELVHIIDCMDTREQIVMPVFYHVNPSDVRKLKRKYDETFSKHERENKHKVESWRKALCKAGNLSGWVINDIENSHEAKCIKDIVRSISGRLSQLITNVNTDLIGMETRLQDLKSKLEIESDGVRVVGIWGVGGGGKTTLASAAYMEISHRFEACCLLENIREESSKHGLKRLQESFLSLVLKTKDIVVRSEIEGRNMIKSRLCHRRVLVVLDDVDDVKQLEALAGSHDWFGAGSRIIITTRNEHLLITRHADIIQEVSLLSHDESIKLFCKHAYGKDKHVEDYEMLSEDVVSYAGGLPLALEILGSFLYDKDKDEWKCALAKLKDIPDDEVTKRLKISYDGLETYQQKLFLDIACFLRGEDVDKAMMVLDACSFYPQIGVKVLVQKSLVKVSDGKIDMHDLIEEMARYIVREEHPYNPEKLTRIWKVEDVADLCAMGEAAPLMEIEVLALPTPVGDESHETFASYIKSSYVSHPHLLDAVANMKKLRWLKLNLYPMSSFPSNFQPTKLGCLTLTAGLLKELWHGCKRLPNLKVLDLRYSELLIKTPDFNGLPCLERLILKFCVKLKEIHPSFGYHERLVHVDMSWCVQLETFPPIIQMKKLETLNLSDCRQLRRFPDIQSNMDSLVNLHLDCSGIEIIPPSVGQFCTNLVSLSLGLCMNLKRIECNFHLLRSLIDLDLNDCRQLLSQHSTLFKNVMECPRFLRKLNLGSCNLGDGDIPSDICELVNLQVLDLHRNQFSRLDSSLSRLSCLKFLNLSGCINLVALQDLPSSIAILNARCCESLESVGNLSNYKWLWKVSFWRLSKNKLIGGERIICSMLQQRNAVEDSFMSILLPPAQLSNPYLNRGLTMTLQLPHNWYSDFSGFSICAYCYNAWDCRIVIKQEMFSLDSQPDYWMEFDKNHESHEYEQACYVPFGSLRHTSWWSTTYTSISFQIRSLGNPKVGLVTRKISKSDDAREGAIDCSQIWDEEHEYKRTFEIIDDSKSSIQILWSPLSHA